MKILLLLVFSLLISCEKELNPYLDSSEEEIKVFKKVDFPFKRGTSFVVTQGAFGINSHNEKGNEYSWDFAVPLETSIHSIEDGVIWEVWQPNKGGGCDQKYSNLAHNVKVLHRDGTVAQYVHIKTSLTKGQSVKKGQLIAITASNGWLCKPHLHFSVYLSKDNLYNSINRKTVPLYFRQSQNGLIFENDKYTIE